MNHAIRPVVAAMALLLTGALAAPAAAAPAAAAPGDYLPLTYASAPKATNPGPNDIREGRVEIDPNAARVDIYVILGRDPGAWVRRAIADVGVKDEAGACHPAVEIVASNAGTLDDPRHPVVRRPGETTLPSEPSTDYGAVIFARRQPVRLVDGLVPDCGQVQITDAAGRVLSTTPLSFTHRPNGAVRLGLGATAYAPAQQRLNKTQSYGYIVHNAAVSGRIYDGRVTVAAPAGVTAAVSSSGPFDDYHHEFRLTLRLTKPGWTSVTVRVSAGNADPIAEVIKVYGAGGPPPTPTGSLAGRTFAATAAWWDADYLTHWSVRAALWFLDNRFVHVGVPKGGRPKCTAAMVDPDRYGGCQRYWWHKQSNALRIGYWDGSVRGRSIRYYRPEGSASIDYTHPVGVPQAGTRLRGTWHDVIEGVEESTTTLVLRKDGTFRFRTNEWANFGRGRYAVGRNGRITLRYRDGKVAVRTVAFGKNRRGRLDPHHTGILLSTPGRHGALRAAWLTHGG